MEISAVVQVSTSPKVAFWVRKMAVGMLQIAKQCHGNFLRISNFVVGDSIANKKCLPVYNMESTPLIQDLRKGQEDHLHR